MSVTAEHIRALMALGIDGEKLLAVVTIIDDASRLSSQETSRDVRDAKSLSAARSKAYRDRKRVTRHAETSRDADKPPLILTSSSLLPEETLSEERKKESSGIRARARKRLGPLPDGWRPNDDAYRLAKELGVDLGPIENRFRDYLKSHGKQYADYDAALRTFINNTPKFNGGRNGNGTGNTRTTGHDAILAVAARKARELDRNDDVAGTANPAGFAFGDGADRSGPSGNSDAARSDQRDHRRDESDDQRIREGEIIPPDQDAAGIPRRRQFV